MLTFDVLFVHTPQSAVVHFIDETPHSRNHSPHSQRHHPHSGSRSRSSRERSQNNNTVSASGGTQPDSSDASDLRALLSSLGVQRLSDAVTAQVIAQGPVPEPYYTPNQGHGNGNSVQDSGGSSAFSAPPSHSLPAMVRHSLRYCQRYLLSTCSPDQYYCHQGGSSV